VRLIRGLGPIAATALVAGNIVGSGIYVIPASLAEVAGPLSLLAWGIVAAGYVCLAFVYADLAFAYPVTGGLQVYVGRAFGRLAELETGFLYWVSCVTANAAFATAFLGYLQVLLPRPLTALESVAVAQALLWTLTLVNVRGVRLGGGVQVATTLLKVLPLVVVSLALLPLGSVSNLQPFAPHGIAALLPALSLVAWMFVGAESVTVPAEEIRDATRTVPRSAFLGLGLATGLYFLVAAALAFGLPPSAIAGSASPLAVAAERAMGPLGSLLVTLGALVSIAGILNGYLLVTGRLPFAAAREGLLPAPFARLHPRFGTPVVGLLASTAVSSLLVLLYFQRTLLQAYELIALASTATALLAIAAACLASFALRRREPERFTAAQRRRGGFMATAGLCLLVPMIGGSGTTVLLLTLAVTALPLAYHLVLGRREPK
jgi:APA family basic amino acid/polyamine antiporter